MHERAQELYDALHASVIAVRTKPGQISIFFFSSRRRHTRCLSDWSSDVCSSDLLARRRLAHEPVARITGAKEFWSLPLRVGEATLVPRPETETVVAAALRALDAKGPRSRPWRIADIGTGSGAIALALLTELPKAFVVGTDISPAALAVARDNARSLGLARDLGRVSYVLCDMASALRGPFDLIVSNPPYIPTGDLDRLAAEVRLFDPRLALDGGADGLRWYRAL